MRFAHPRALIIPAALVGGYLTVNGCGNDPPSGPTGGPVSGAADMHCVLSDGGLNYQPTDQASCQLRPPDAAPGAPDAAQGGEFGATMFGTSGADDDCKYHYAWTSTPIYRSYDVHFTLTLTDLSTMQPATGAAPYIEATLNDIRSAPPTDPKTHETSPGVYDIGPIQFDAMGQWNVRFHVYGTCLDAVETSPHGHAAFFVNVP